MDTLHACHRLWGCDTLQNTPPDFFLGDEDEGKRRRYTRKITHLDLLYTLLQIEAIFTWGSSYCSPLRRHHSLGLGHQFGRLSSLPSRDSIYG